MKKIPFIIFALFIVVFAYAEAMDPEPDEARARGQKKSSLKPPMAQGSLTLEPLTFDQEEEVASSGPLAPSGAAANGTLPSIVLCGLPGSGKTSLSLILSFWAQGRMPWVNQDMYGGNLPAFLRALERREGPVIVDKGHWTAKHRDSTRKALGGKEKGRTLWVFLDPSAIGLEGLLMRIQERKDGHATLYGLPQAEYTKILERMMGELELPTDKECPHLVTLDPQQPLEKSFGAIEKAYMSRMGSVLPKDFAVIPLAEAMAQARHFQAQMTHAFLERPFALAKENSGAPQRVYIQIPEEVGSVLRKLRGSLKKDYGAVHAGLSGKRYERELMGVLYSGEYPDLRWLGQYWRFVQAHMGVEVLCQTTYFKWDAQTMVLGVKILTPAFQEIAPGPIEVLLGQSTHQPIAEKKMAEAVSTDGQFIALQEALPLSATFMVAHWGKQDAVGGAAMQRKKEPKFPAKGGQATGMRKNKGCGGSATSAQMRTTKF